MKSRSFTLIVVSILIILFFLFVISFNRYQLAWQEQEMEKHAIVIEEDFWALDTQGPVKYLTLVSERENYANIAIVGLNGDEFLSIEGPIFKGLDLFAENIGLIPKTHMVFDIKHNGEVIGQLKADYRNKNIYIDLYAFALFVLIYFVFYLFFKTVKSKHQLEDRVRDRTLDLEEEIDERIRVESELKDARNYITSIIDSMPSMLVGVDAQNRITQWNKTAELNTRIKADQAKGRNLVDLLPQMEGKLNYIEESIKSLQIKQEQKILRKEGNISYYDDITVYPLIDDFVVGAVIRIDDVTARVRLEEVMIQSEKMLSVGGLAAGMAHEINNPLGGMMQTANVLENRLGKKLDMPANIKAAEEAGTTMAAIKKFMDSRDIPRMINSINESGRRMAEIIENMLNFSRKSDGRTTAVRINELIEKTVELAATDYDLKKQYDFKLVEIIREFDSDFLAIPCESAKIQQVLLNLLRNGAQAMQEGGIKNPKFIIRTKIDQSRQIISIEVEDNGPGMDESVRKRVFEPFFTTKPVGIGTGLGLSVSYFIVTENHGGEMEVESQPGRGAKFTIRLPIKNKQ
ncbi:MAG: ATP-binding protein [Spirochaetaceae bacterium]|jgi:PAS domain S-box-containing protein|nr:ATP-binding protein [Spirochaetaceae bacterium]